MINTNAPRSISMPDDIEISSTRGHIISTTPSGYRLVRKNGELSLQVAYKCQHGSNYSHEWQDIPTVDL